MFWLLSLTLHLSLVGMSLIKRLALTAFGRQSSSDSPFLIVVLAVLMFNSLFITLGLAILDPNAKLSADSVMLRMFTRPPIALDFRLMWQLVCLSWRVRGVLRTICRIYVTFLRVVITARHKIWSAYPAFWTIYPVMLAFNRVLLSYMRVALASYRVLRAAFKFRSAASRISATILLLQSIRVLSKELFQLTLLSYHLVVAGATLSRQALRLFAIWGVPVLVASLPHLRAASRHGAYALYTTICVLVAVGIAQMRIRTRILLSLPISLVLLLLQAKPREASPLGKTVPLKASRISTSANFKVRI